MFFLTHTNDFFLSLSVRLIKTNRIYFYHDKNKWLNVLFVEKEPLLTFHTFYLGVHCFISALRNILWLCLLFCLFIVLIFMFVWDVYLRFFSSLVRAFAHILDNAFAQCTPSIVVVISLEVDVEDERV